MHITAKVPVTRMVSCPHTVYNEQDLTILMRAVFALEFMIKPPNVIHVNCKLRAVAPQLQFKSILNQFELFYLLQNPMRKIGFSQLNVTKIITRINSVRLSLN